MRFAKLFGIAVAVLAACIGAFVLLVLARGAQPTIASTVNAAAVQASGLDDIYKKVATDAVAQYEITKRGGAVIDICVHAGLVAAAFLQAKDEASYRTWKQTERADCTAAGVPGQ
jgi:hypothetical protein